MSQNSGDKEERVILEKRPVCRCLEALKRVLLPTSRLTGRDSNDSSSLHSSTQSQCTSQHQDISGPYTL